jgi:hypothetical protein
MTTGPSEPSTYPDSWEDLPGTRTHKPGKEHENAPVKKGEHTRDDLNQPDKSTPGYF